MPKNENSRSNSDRNSNTRSNSDRRSSSKPDKEPNSLNGFESEIDGQIEPSTEGKEE